jgi:PKD domain
MKIARRLLLLGLIIFAIVNCDQVDFTAPTGSTLSISVQPPTVANNGNANVTVVGTRANGAPLPDETVINFTTNLGSISPNPVKTDNGIATTTFRAGIRSGTATITASSGAADAVTVDVIVGEARPQQVILVADPATLPVGGGTIELRAHVSDGPDGNPLSGISVFFAADAGTLESGGRTVRTNDAGIAVDHLTTNVETNVTATTGNGATGTLLVRISPGGGAECSFNFSPESPVVDQEVFFIDTSTSNDGPPIVQSLWDFGDGETAEGFTATHSYAAVGTFVVTHTIIDEEGFTTICTQTIIVTRGEPVCQFLFSPPDPVNGDVVTFDASEAIDENGEIITYVWNFGDGSPIETEPDPVIQHIFPLCGPDDVELNFTVLLTVIDNDGQTDSCSDLVSIECPAAARKK